jgi:transcriptional regulator with XRE-family HTH domain
MTTDQLQQTLFHHIKTILPPHVSMVDEVAELLGISNDSAYRRIRGEKPLTLDESYKLAGHFKISLDQLFLLRKDAFIFTGRTTNNSDFKYEDWLQAVVQHLQYFLSFKPCHLYYLAKEIPFYYYFLVPEIAAFKSYFFMKSILYYDDWKAKKFSVEDDYSHYKELFQKISHLFSLLPSTEIWSIENITSTLHQIEFYRVTGALKSNEDALILLDKFFIMIDHLEKQAEYGIKLKDSQDPTTSRAPFRMFVNELIMGDNVQLMQLGEKYMTAINHSIINFITTTDEAFNLYMKKTIDNLAQKSTLISEVNEKERLMFFNRLREKVSQAKKQITS